MLEQIEKDIEGLEEAIRRKERWEVSETMRADTGAEAGTYEAAMAAKVGGEVVKTGKVVGAEKEREQLERLLIRRCELLGEDANLVLAAAGFGGLYGGKADDLAGNAMSRFKGKAMASRSRARSSRTGTRSYCGGGGGGGGGDMSEAERDDVCKIA